MNYSLLVTCEVTWRYLRTNKHRMVHAFSYTNQKMKKLILSMALAAFALLGKAYDFEANGFYYNITSLSDLTVALTGNEGASYSGDITIPKSVEYSGKTFTITSIDSSTFSKSILGTLTIPKNIMKADISASSVEKLIIEDSRIPLEELFAKAAKDVYMGRDINVPWNHLIYSFSYSSIESIVFGDSVTYIPGGMLEECTKLVSVELSSNIKSIFNEAFIGCTKLKTISGEGIELIETGAFYNCTSLESFNFPSLKVIDNGDSQWGTYRWGVFQNCKSLRNVVLSQGLFSIGTMAFMGCESLESVTIPASVMYIGDVYNIEHSSVFADCPNLTSITVNASSPIAIGETTFDAQTYINTTLIVPAGAKDEYLSATNWKNFFNIEENTNITDNVYSVVIEGCSDSYGGYVEIGDLRIKDNKYVMSANKGDKITLRFMPLSNEEENYELGSVTIDEKDVTSNVVNNELIVEVTGNMTIDIDWDYVEANPILLTIKQAENGCTKMVVDKWDTYKFFIEPSEGWTLHSVALNGEDITNRVGDDGALKLSEISENTTLSITFESNGSSVKAINPSRAKVYGADNSIVISGANEGENIQIYDDAGLLIETVKATSNSMRIPLANGIYIVKLDGKTVKVAI